MATDPYKYFRVEARELLDGLAQGALELEKGAGDRSLVGSLLRLAHTLKGASRVVRQPDIAELAHGVEDILSPFREGAGPVPKERAREMLKTLDRIGTGLAALDAPVRAQGATVRVAPEEAPDTVRVEVDEVEALLASLSQAGVHLTAVENAAGTVGRARRMAAQIVQKLELPAPDRNGSGPKIRVLTEDLLGCLQRLEHSLGTGIDRVQQEFTQSRELASHLRLLPSATIFPALTRAVRDAAVALGKRAELYSTGGEIRLDAQVLTLVRAALLHLVRNAVAHGIEAEETRAEAGKPGCGRIELRIERRGDRVAFICRDDGVGIDVGAIRQVAVKKGIISATAAESLGLREAIDLILRGGVSTTPEVTGISGRGIGLDIVRETAARLKGDISVDTIAGRGTAVEICVPVSLTSVPALNVDSGGVRASIPLECVRRTLRLAGSEIIEGGGSQSISYGGRAIPFFALSLALGGAEATHRGPWSAVIVASGSALVAVGVDKLVGTGTVLAHSLPALAAPSRAISGASLDAEGNPQLVLDPMGLVEVAGAAAQRRAAAASHRLPILIIDDSLTTRMVEQSILESAGHQVEVAASAEEALEMARAHAYSLFLVDVEMPGMDGFEFVSRTRQDPVLRETPAILVTSRNSPDDRRRGEAAGARSYIVKSEFDQGRFLQTVEQLARC